MLIVDGTGDLEKGVHTVGVLCQYTGTAGRIETRRSPCSPALDAGVTASWVTGDEVYGADPRFRATPENRGVGHVLANKCDRGVVTGAGANGHRFFYRCYAPDPVALASWSASPEPAGLSKNPFEPAKGWPVWISISSAAGLPGGAGPFWRCARTRSSPPSPQPKCPRSSTGRLNRLDPQGNPAPRHTRRHNDPRHHPPTEPLRSTQAPSTPSPARLLPASIHP